MSEFDELWKFATRYGEIQQERSELEHIFNLIKNCGSYLEIGCAEGASLAVLGKNKDRVAYVDLDEDHTRRQREESVKSLNVLVQCFHGNSHSNEIINRLTSNYNVVFIDGGHRAEDVIADAIAYGILATKYLLFHDVQLPSVKQAFDWYCQQQKYEKVRTFINSDTYGYGIIEV